jgi:phosphomannomutase
MVVPATVETLRKEDTPLDLVVVGFDTRMLSEKFAKTAAELLASNGVAVELTPRDVPSPTVASMVLERKAAAGLTFTGSHNPPEYNGLKIYTRDGILASDAFTARVEKRFSTLEKKYDDTFLPRADLVGSHDPKPV